MKTTIDFPDDLLYRAKVVAAERRTTLRNLAVTGLEKVLESNDHSDSGKKERIRNFLSALQASNTEPMVPLTREEIYDRGLKD